MNIKKDIDIKNEQNNKISEKDKEKEKKEYINISTKSQNQDNPSFINYLQFNLNNKLIKKSKNYKSEKNCKPEDLQLPYMSLIKPKSYNIKINTLLNLEPFFSDFNNIMDNQIKFFIS